MIHFPRTLDEAASMEGEIRAGGSDVMDRFRSGVSTGPVVDLRDLEGLDRLERREDGGWSVGAMLRLSRLLAHPEIRRGYPALAAAVGDCATPQIRAVATVGGNLLQRTRCWYYRNPAFDCFKTGGDHCPAREGDNLYGICIDLGPCVAPHPSTAGLALLTYDARVEVHGGPERSIAGLYGDGSEPASDNTLVAGEILTAVRLPPPLAGELGGYHRAVSRAQAEWPLVDAVARLRLDSARREITFARVAVGGVANIPLRRKAIEARLVGSAPTRERLEWAAEVAGEDADPLSLTAYKAKLLPGTVLAALQAALANSGGR